MLVALYVGGRIVRGVEGAQYTKDAAYGFQVTENTSFLELKQIVYEKTGINPNRYDLNLVTRILSVRGGNRPYYTRYPITDENLWRCIYLTLESQSTPVMDLYSIRVPRQSGVGPSRDNAGYDNPGYENSGYDNSGYDNSRYESNAPPVYGNSGYDNSGYDPYVPPVYDHSDDYVTDLPPPPPPHEPVVPIFPAVPLSIPILSPVVVRSDTNIDGEGIDAIPEKEMDTGDDWDGDWDSDHLSDGDGDYLPRDDRFPIRGRTDRHPVHTFNDTTDFEEADITFFGKRVVYNSELAPDQVYTNIDELAKKINEVHVNGNWECLIQKRDRKRLVVVCKDAPRCGFRLFATPVGRGEAWIIKKCEPPHTCKSASSRTDHAQLTASLIADVIEMDVKEDPSISIKEVARAVRRAFAHVTPKYNRLWRGRELAICRMFGSWKGSYNLLAPLLQAIASTNPGTKYQCWNVSIPDSNNEVQFKGIAWAFGPCIQAVPYIRPVISIDACFMSGRYDGRLLIACGYDAENQLLPLAFAIVEKEDGENWRFFMSFLRTEVLGSRFFCVISDQHKGIKYVFDRTDFGFSTADGDCVHRLCMQHVSDNLNKHCGFDKWVADTFKISCRRKKPRRVEEMFREFAKYCPKANAYLLKVGKDNPRDLQEPPRYEKIFQARDGGWRWGIMTTNGSECLNNVFKQSRMLPVAAIVEDTFYKLNAWFVERRVKALELLSRNQTFSTRIEGKLSKHRRKGSVMRVVPYGDRDLEFEVHVPDEFVPTSRRPNGTMEFVKRAFKYVVIFGPHNSVTCTCQGIQLSHLPCSHVMAVCRERNFREDDYVADFYRTDYLASTWGASFHPYPNQYQWPPYVGNVVLPAKKWIRLGRRPHKRAVMTMDQMQGRRMGHQARRSTSDRQRAGTFDFIFYFMFYVFNIISCKVNWNAMQMP